MMLLVSQHAQMYSHTLNTHLCQPPHTSPISRVSRYPTMHSFRNIQRDEVKPTTRWLWTCMCMMQNRYVTHMWRQHVRGGNNSEMSSHQPTERCPEKSQHSQAYQIRNREWCGSRPGHTIDAMRLDYPTKFLIGEVPAAYSAKISKIHPHNTIANLLSISSIGTT